MMIPRPEHPRPQFQREDWINLNGLWQFEIDNGRSGEARGLARPETQLAGQITVPFCPESRLSGVEHTDFLYGVWYKRQVTIPAEKMTGQILLQFGAVDYQCTAFVNGQKAGVHQGGYGSFSFDITPFVKAGENQITVFAEDDTRNPLIPRGKQCEAYFSGGCDYTRTTGIWQTVWLEFRPKTHIASVQYYPDPERSCLNLRAELAGKGTLTVRAFYEGRQVGQAELASGGGLEHLTLSLSETHLWEIGAGRLYDLELSYGEDRVKSYFGLRTVRMEEMKFLLNGKSVFQRLVLDQGFYPDGLYTAPSDAELLADVERSLAMGFNGARLHQKVFEERFLYHCDKMGYIVWGEYGSWGLDHSRLDSIYGILPDWMSIVRRDFNHPAIIGWCPYNETWDQHGCRQANEPLSTIYDVTKAMDPTRPCIDTSGNFHVKTDIYDLHDYDQNPETLAQRYAPFAKEGGELADRYPDRQTYRGEPVFISEYGGIAWSVHGGWGYGEAPKTEEEFLSRLKGLTDVLLDHPRMFGYCYTQLTDIEQEQNGLYTYDRKPKFDPEIIRPILSRKAAIED
ncbi:MAG: beta-galactosidase [Ruminococcaceae bacterium]|nr:beta-galactosidase [Oscillospiraceae bacterium]